MNYSDLTDFEINKLVAEALGFECPSLEGRLSEVFRHRKGNPMRDEKTVNYCNNPNDAWPIILENKVCLDYNYMKSEWLASIFLFNGVDDFDQYESKHVNPLRAACIVFIMMNEG